ncbi:MAG: transposase [Actinomycetota bacterium]|nr:transposase [Actinomycetota bacterium]
MPTGAPPTRKGTTTSNTPWNTSPDGDPLAGIGRQRGRPLAELGETRRLLHGCFERRADALFDLTDAILSAGMVPSPAHLSLAAAHRRGWASLYAALRHGRVDEEALRELLARYAIPDGFGGGPAVYAVDVSVWPRCDAEASPGRGYYYHPSETSPITSGSVAFVVNSPYR